MDGNPQKYIWQHDNWPRFQWHSGELLTLLGKVRHAQGGLSATAKALGFELSHQAQAEILVEEAVKTSAIEGEALNRDSVRSSVARRLGLPQAGAAPAERHVDGLVEILLDATRNHHEPLTAQRLKGWQAALFPTGYSGIRKIRVGDWRDGPIVVVSGPEGRQKVHFEAPPGEVVAEEMKRFLQWWKKSLGREEGVLRAGVAHLWFVTVHPFEDGNGRIARAITDMALAQDEQQPLRLYSFSSQIMEERDDYYAVLEQTQKGTLDITAWLTWFLGCLLRSMDRSEAMIHKVLTKARFWQRHSQTTLNDQQKKIVNRLLDAGEGEFHGGLTTRKYVAIAKTSRSTAIREINDLVEKQVLVRGSQSKGRSVWYDLNWEELSG
ncbi:MAG: Fic family protein [Candidatus Omnitrophica bacterium]|nr:Fic family protein [Candidatus Omnitrophota bacterium]